MQTGFTGLDCSVDIEQLAKLTCLEGSLKQATAVDGGKAFSACVCVAPEQCGWLEPAVQPVVVCDPGFELKGVTAGGIRFSDGRVMDSGGSCKKLRRGTSGGMVFFYCVLSIFLFCGCVVGGKYGLEWYQLRRAGQVRRTR